MHPYTFINVDIQPYTYIYTYIHIKSQFPSVSLGVNPEHKVDSTFFAPPGVIQNLAQTHRKKKNNYIIIW